MAIATRTARDLVDHVNGEISREIFSNEDIYAQELEKVFARAWLYVGHESQVKNPGDFFVSRMGEESVILVRDTAGEVRVFLNSCAHRGMKVCRYDSGNTRAFKCPYHAWTYKTDGTLLAVQDYDNAYKPPFDKSEWGLMPVAKVANYMGLIWATWNEDAPSIEDYLGGATFGFDNGMCAWDGSDAPVELLGTTQKWKVPCNWKFVAENFAGDWLHGVSHRSVDMVKLGPSGDVGRRDDYGQLIVNAYPEGHGMLYSVFPNQETRTEYAMHKPTSEYYQAQWEKRLKNKGDLAGTCPLVGTIFPNMSFHSQQPRTLLMSHPNGPNETEMWRNYYVDANAPDEVKQFLREYYMRYSGPAGMTEQDDMENWGYAHAAAGGTISRRRRFHYKSGLGAGGTHDVIPGVVTEQPITSEQNPRYFYQRWAQYMDLNSWEEMLDVQNAPA